MCQCQQPYDRWATEAVSKLQRSWSGLQGSRSSLAVLRRQITNSCDTNFRLKAGLRTFERPQLRRYVLSPLSDGPDYNITYGNEIKQLSALLMESFREFRMR